MYLDRPRGSNFSHGFGFAFGGFWAQISGPWRIQVGIFTVRIQYINA